MCEDHGSTQGTCSPASSCGLRSSSSGASSRRGPPRGGSTTVVLRDVPYAFSLGDLMRLMDAEGFRGKYDFVYLPIDYPTFQNIGTAHINLASQECAEGFLSHFEGFSSWGRDCPKVATARWSRSQGRQELIALYRNSPVMHGSVPEHCKPVLFRDGQQVPFPKPTVRLPSGLAPAPPQAAAALGDEHSVEDDVLLPSSLLAGINKLGVSAGRKEAGLRAPAFAARGEGDTKATCAASPTAAPWWKPGLGLRRLVHIRL